MAGVERRTQRSAPTQENTPEHTPEHTLEHTLEPGLPASTRVQLLLAARCGPGGSGLGIPRLMQASRDEAARYALTGGLLFDGETVVQCLDGPADAVHRLAAQWLAHPALREARLLQELGPVTAGPPLSMPWLAGFVDGDALESVVQAPSPLARMAAFTQALLRADAL